MMKTDNNIVYIMYFHKMQQSEWRGEIFMMK